MKQKRLKRSERDLYNEEKETFEQHKKLTIHKKKRLKDSRRDLLYRRKEAGH
jgi:hypothetical protein